jgi:hypothetical protein
MTLLLVLGSKPDPMLPAADRVGALACANASGRSAAAHGLPMPLFTVMTAVLTSGKASDDHSLQALRGLATQRLYFVPRPRLERAAGLVAGLAQRIKTWRMSPWWMRRQLRRLGYGYGEMIVRPASWYHELVLGLCGHDAEIAALIAAKQPSTGLLAVALGLADPAHDPVVMAGFDFTLRHAYGVNPLIAERGDALSRHADTDTAILRRLVARQPRLRTTEPAVHARTGAPLLTP